MKACGNRAAAPRSSVQGGRVRLILVGNPNCGKSTLFNALTGAHARTGNWHGVTVGAAARRADLNGVPAEICDLPGVYSLRPYSMEEKAACRAIEAGDYDLAVCVADALTLPRSLALVRDLARCGRPAVLVVTMLDLLEGRGGRLNAAGLSARLGIPVLAVSAHKRADIARLRAFLRKEAERAARVGASEHAAAAPSVGVSSGKAAAVRRVGVREGSTREGGTDRGGGCAARLGGAEALGADVYRPGGRRSALADRLFYDPRFALPLFAACLLAVFFLAFAEGMPGMLCKGALEGLLADGVGGRLASLAEGAGVPVAADFLRSFFGSVGMVLSFLPQIVLLELALALLEESGLLSAVAFLTDGIFRRAGLTGRAAFSLLMGFAAASGRRHPRLYQLRREDARLPDGRRRLLPASVSRRRRPVRGGAAARLRGGAAAAPADPRRGGVRPRNGASAASPPAPRAPFLAFFRKTVYNKGRNGGDGISRRALGAPLVHLHLPLCGGGQRGEHARARLPRLFLPVLSDGRDAVAGGAGGAHGHRREGERGGHPRPLLRRGSVRGVHAGVRRRLSHLHPDLFALRVGRRRRRARGGRPPRAGHGSRADGRRLRDVLSRLRASLRGRARRKPARRGAPRAAVLSSQEGS